MKRKFAEEQKRRAATARQGLKNVNYRPCWLRDEESENVHERRRKGDKIKVRGTTD
jgi:hypothetical protein